MIALLLPPVIMMRMNLYADYVINASSCLYLALILHIIDRKIRMTPRYALALLITAIVLATSKLVYFPLVLTVFLIPAQQFGSPRQHHCAMALLVSMCAVSVAISVIMGLKGSYGIDIFSASASEESAPNAAALHLLLTSPGSVLEKVAYTYFDFTFWTSTWKWMCIWMTRLHSLYMPLGTYSEDVYTSLLAIPFLVCVAAKTQGLHNCYRLALWQRVWLLLLVGLTALLIALGVFVDVANIESPDIWGIQGRYFSALLPYTAVAFTWYVPEQSYQRIASAQLLVSMVVLLIFYQSLL